LSALETPESLTPNAVNRRHTEPLAVAAAEELGKLGVVDVKNILRAGFEGKTGYLFEGFVLLGVGGLRGLAWGHLVLLLLFHHRN
jgi:hypothetical protein